MDHLGLIVGIVAKFLMPGRDPVLLGGIDPVGFVVAVLGPSILLALYRMMVGRRQLRVVT